MDVSASVSSLLLSCLLIASVWMKVAGERCVIPDENRMDLSEQNLTAVPPNLPQNIQYLDLSFNAISTLTSQDLASLSALCIFKMTNCGLTTISTTAFEENPLLEELDLSFNTLSTIPELQGLPNLRVFDLAENPYKSFTLGESFENLPSLSSLSLGGPQVSCLEQFDLKPLKSSPLHELSLRAGDELTNFSTDFLGYLPKLKSLTVQINFCKTPQLFSDILFRLQKSGVDTLTIEKFLPEFCDVSANLTDELRNLGKLQHLTFKSSWYNGSLLSQAIVHVIQSQLQTLSFLNTTYVQDKEEGLVILSVPDPSKTGSLRVFTLNTLHHHQYTYFKSTLNLTLFEGLEKAELIAFGISGPNDGLPMASIGDLTTLKILDVSNNNFACSNLQNSLPFHFLTNLRELVLRGNKLETLHKVAFYIQFFTQLQILDVSFNPIKLPEHKKVIWPLHLKKLSLSENRLGNPLFDVLSAHLQSLNLTKTDITSLNTDVLRDMKELKQLFLGSNAIKELPSNLALPELEELHVDHNSIDTFKQESFQGLPKLRRLNGGHNPFACDCNLIWFVNSFNKTLLVDWPAAYRCSLPSYLKGKLLKDYTPSFTCNKVVLGVIVSLSTVGGLLVFGILFYVVDAVWYTKMTWYYISRKLRGQNAYRRLENSTFRYHAFVSHSREDAQWVNDELVPHLQARQLRLCMHEQDFDPNEWIIDKMMESVQDSYKTLFVLSQSFIQSEWCTYVLNFAQRHAIDNQEDSLVLVLLEPIPLYWLRRLRYLQGQRACLTWPEEEPKRQLFWASLAATLEAGNTNVLRQVATDIAGLCDNVDPDSTEDA